MPQGANGGAGGPRPGRVFRAAAWAVAAVLVGVVPPAEAADDVAARQDPAAATSSPAGESGGRRTAARPVSVVTRGDGFTVGPDDQPSMSLTISGTRLGRPAAAGSWQRRGSVLTRSLGAEAVERLTERGSSVEWDVVLNVPTRAAVTVTSHLRAPVAPRRTKDRLVWDVPAAGRLVMGRLVVVDATGRRLHTELPTVRGSAVELHVPASALRDAVFPVTLDPTISAEHPPSAPTYEGAAPGAPALPAVTWDAASGAYSAVWQDSPYTVSLTRITAAGNVLDAPGTKIVDATPTFLYGTALASSGSTRLLVWAENYEGGTLRARTIAANGALGTPVTIAPSVAGAAHVEPQVASDGSGFVVVWRKQVAGADEVRAARVAVDGTVTAPGGVALGAAGAEKWTPAVTAEASGYLVAWAQGAAGSREIRAIRLSSAGAPVGSALSITGAGSDATSPDVSFESSSGTDLVVWHAAGAVQLARLSGSALSGPPTAVAAVLPTLPRVASSSTGSLVTWGDEGTAKHQARRVAPGGALGAPGDLGTGLSGTLATDDTDYLSVWNYGYKLYGRVVDGATGTAEGTEPFLVARGLNPEKDPDVAWNGTTHLAVWTDRRSLNGSWDIYAARVAGDGTMQDGTGVALAVSGDDETEPSVSSVGSDFLVAWRRQLSGGGEVIETRLVSSTGVVGSITALASSASDARSPRVTSSSTGYLVTWIQNLEDVYTTLVSSTGAASTAQLTLDGSAQAIPSIYPSFQSVEAASDGTGFMLLAVLRTTGYYGYFWNVKRARLDANGAKLEQYPSEVEQTSGFPSIGLSYGSGTYLATWADGVGLRARPISTANVLGTPLLVHIDDASDAGYLRNVSLDTDNGTFLVTWLRGSGALQVRGARLSATQVFDTSPFVIASGDGLDHVAATGAGGRYAVAYERLDSVGPVPRVFVRMVDGAVLGDAFEAPQVLTGSSGTAPGDTVLATKQASEPAHAGNAGGHSIWFSWTAPATGRVFVDTAGSTFDTLLGVYTGSAVAGLSEVAANDNASAGGRSGVAFDAVSGTTYRFAVDGVSGARGGVELAWGPVAANDDLDTATPIVTTNGSAQSHTAGTGKELGEPDHAGNAGGHSVWYSLTASAEGLYAFDTEGSTFDTLLGAYTGSEVDALTPVTSNDDAVGLAPGSSKVFVRLDQGETVLLAVDGKAGVTGRAELTWVFTPAPANDDFANAAPLELSYFGEYGTNVGASLEPGEPSTEPGGASVWYHHTPALDGTLRLEVYGYRDLIAVYTGSALSALTLVGGNYAGSPLSLPVTAGTTYYVSVDSDLAADPGLTTSFSYTASFLDTQAPTTTINTHPPAIGKQTAVTFTFSADEPSTFVCKLDTAAEAPCTSPKSYSGLSNGSHTFTVRATDPSDNVGAHQQFDFTVDTVAPDTNITSGPTGTTKSTTADVAFVGSEPGLTFQCSLDAAAFSTCTSPRHLTGLTSRSHEFRVRAVDAAGNPDPFPASRTWTVDTVPPVPVLKPLASFATSRSITVGWGTSGTEAAKSYDVRFLYASQTTATLSSWTTWKSATTATSAVLTGGVPGRTYCFQVRARDALGNVSAFTTSRCSAVPLDDRALSGTGWSRLTSSGFFLGTYSRSLTKGATLSLGTVKTRQIALLAYRCPGCGKVNVYLGSTLVKTVDLNSTTTRKLNVISLASYTSLRTGTVRIVVVSSGKPVLIDGLGLRAA